MPLSPDDYARIDALCPELQKILDDELAAGNRVATTFEGWGTVVMLEQHFRAQHDIERGRVTFHDVSDPHYWKAQYSVKELDQHLACKF